MFTVETGRRRALRNLSRLRRRAEQGASVTPIRPSGDDGRIRPYAGPAASSNARALRSIGRNRHMVFTGGGLYHAIPYDTAIKRRPDGAAVHTPEASAPTLVKLAEKVDAIAAAAKPKRRGILRRKAA